MAEDDDMIADAALNINDNALKSISATVAEYDSLAKENEALVIRSEEIVKKLTFLKTHTLPELLAAAGVSSFTDTTTGRVVDLSLLVTGSLVKDDAERRAAQLDYIKSLGGASLVKVKLTVNFERGEIKEAEQLAAQIELLRWAPSPNLTEDIHPQTLMAWGRERVQNGMALEPEKAGLYVVNVAIPHEPKTRRVKVK